ncbi:hypothetical protein L596_009564 [Steinernema carpocapsae]|uniref:Uncharacterized protein n=1 Tax=Steinernema carpocapsae TaxID=34508 RepID=A0A4U5PFX3_STECR|nr:hypothetical protein L596_009564 [Steinernema carpocapsae]
MPAESASADRAKREVVTARLEALRQAMDVFDAKLYSRPKLEICEEELARKHEVFMEKIGSLFTTDKEQRRRCEKPWKPVWKRFPKLEDLSEAEKFFRSLSRLLNRVTWGPRRFAQDLEELVELGERKSNFVQEIVLTIIEAAAKSFRFTTLFCGLLKLAVDRWLQSEVKTTVDSARKVGEVLMKRMNPRAEDEKLNAREMADYLRVLLTFTDCGFVTERRLRDLQRDYLKKQNCPRFGYHYVIGVHECKKSRESLEQRLNKLTCKIRNLKRKPLKTRLI